MSQTVSFNWFVIARQEFDQALMTLTFTEAWNTIHESEQVMQRYSRVGNRGNPRIECAGVMNNAMTDGKQKLI